MKKHNVHKVKQTQKAKWRALSRGHKSPGRRGKRISGLMNAGVDSVEKDNT